VDDFQVHEVDNTKIQGGLQDCNDITPSLNFEVLLTVHFSIFVSVINQLDAQNFCLTISLFHASTSFEHMCLKHVEA